MIETLSSPRSLHSLDELKELLTSQGHDLAGWGKGATKTVEALWEEVQNGETKIVGGEEGAVRQTRAIGLDVWYTSPEGIRYRLREDRQVYANGGVRRRELVTKSMPSLKIL